MSPPHFDAPAELEALRRQRATARRRHYTSSRLTRYRAELVALRRVGASHAELAQWLRQSKRVVVDRSTVRRYLAQLPELQGPPSSEQDDEHRSELTDSARVLSPSRPADADQLGLSSWPIGQSGQATIIPADHDAIMHVSEPRQVEPYGHLSLNGPLSQLEPLSEARHG